METEAVVLMAFLLSPIRARMRVHQQTAPIGEWRSLTRDGENEIARRGGSLRAARIAKAGFLASGSLSCHQLARFSFAPQRCANATLVKVNFRPRQAGRLTAP